MKKEEYLKWITEKVATDSKDLLSGNTLFNPHFIKPHFIEEKIEED